MEIADLGIFKKTWCLAVLCFWMSACPQESSAQDQTTAMSGTLLIRNVTLIDQRGETEDTIVDILIRDNQLDAIIQEKISRDMAKLAMDGKKAFCYGS